MAAVEAWTAGARSGGRSACVGILVTELSLGAVGIFGALDANRSLVGHDATGGRCFARGAGYVDFAKGSFIPVGA